MRGVIPRTVVLFSYNLLLDPNPDAYIASVIGAFPFFGSLTLFLNRSNRASFAYCPGLTPSTRLNPRRIVNRPTPVAFATSASRVRSSACSFKYSVTAAIAPACGSALASVRSGSHRLHARYPAASACAGVGKKLTCFRVGRRLAQLGLQ